MSFQVDLNQGDGTLHIFPTEKKGADPTSSLQKIYSALEKGYELWLPGRSNKRSGPDDLKVQNQLREIVQLIAKQDPQNMELQELATKVQEFSKFSHLPFENKNIVLEHLPLRALLSYEESHRQGRALVHDVVFSRARRFGYEGSDLTEAKKYLDAVELVAGENYDKEKDLRKIKDFVKLCRNPRTYELGTDEFEARAREFVGRIRQRSVDEIFEFLNDIYRPQATSDYASLSEVVLVAGLTNKNRGDPVIISHLNALLKRNSEEGEIAYWPNFYLFLTSFGGDIKLIQSEIEDMAKFINTHAIGIRGKSYQGSSPYSSFYYFHVHARTEEFYANSREIAGSNVDMFERPQRSLKDIKGSLGLLLSDTILAQKDFRVPVEACLLLAAERINSLEDPQQLILKKILSSLPKSSYEFQDRQGNTAIHLAAKEGNWAFLKEFTKVCPSSLLKLTNQNGKTPLQLVEDQLRFTEDGGELQQLIPSHKQILTNPDQPLLMPHEVVALNEDRQAYRQELLATKDLLLKWEKTAG